VTDKLGAWLDGEPTVAELLADPIVDLLMRYDGITVEYVSAAIRNAQARLNSRHPETDRAA